MLSAPHRKYIFHIIKNNNTASGVRQQITTLARVSRSVLLCTFEQSSSLLETLKVQKKKNLEMAQIHFCPCKNVTLHIQVHVSESNGNGSKDDLGVLSVGFVWFVWTDEGKTTLQETPPASCINSAIPAQRPLLPQRQNDI